MMKAIKDSERIDAIESGFSIWQEINLSTAETIWFCQYSIEGVTTGSSLRDAIDKALVANVRIN